MLILMVFLAISFLAESSSEVTIHPILVTDSGKGLLRVWQSMLLLRIIIGVWMCDGVVIATMWLNIQAPATILRMKNAPGNEFTAT
ncbi:hypothetical protein V6N13_050978 [Hibiscus sabdariffa]